MPPTRGHDLKLKIILLSFKLRNDAPHTGARLETLEPFNKIRLFSMPPTRGHDLKLASRFVHSLQNKMPPTRGHDLKQLTLKDFCK